jgi:tetratricopeptide (TPR) repeat protein
MTKENLLFGIVGLLLGLIVGFMFANSVNQNAMKAQIGGMPSNSAIPPGHPNVGGQGDGTQPEVQAAIDKAKASPDDFEAQIKAAEVYYQIQRFEQAVEFLKQANKIKPDDYETIVNVGNAYFDARKYEDAEKWYAQALVKKADDVNVRTDLGLTFVFRQTPNYPRAIQEFERSLALDPAHIQTLQNITVAYTKNNDAAKAKASLAKLEEVDPSNSAIAKLREDIQKLETK